MMKTKILLIFLLIGAIAATAQQLEPTIAQYYGDVTGAPDGTEVQARTGGNTFKTTTTAGKYGYASFFYITGVQNAVVEFFIENNKVGETIFKKYSVEKIDLPYGGPMVGLVNCTDNSFDSRFETDVDCGGQCPPCATGLMCDADTDCIARDCTNNVCRPGPRGASCYTDNDCSMSSTPPSDNCVAGTCTYPKQCYNSHIDPEETDEDCGGICPACDNDKACEVNADCKSGYCIIVQGAATKQCKTRPTPQPSSRGGGGGGGASAGWRKFYEEPEEIKVETDAHITCTGQWICGPFGECQPGNAMYRDCEWIPADPTQICHLRPPAPRMVEQCTYILPAEPTCYDGIQNQGETGIDCGGPCAPCFIEEVPERRAVSPWVWLAVPFFLLIVGLVAWLVLRPVRIIDAKSYVKSAARRGWSKQEIADKLREAGYTEEQVQRAFRK